MNVASVAQPQTITDEGVPYVPGLLSRWVLLANGARAHYITAGERGPPVIFLHGNLEGASGTASWASLAGFLGARGFRVYAPDRPGYGLADTSRVEYLEQGPKAQVEFLRMFADALCLDKFHLSGESGGTSVAGNFAVSHPDRLLGVAYIAGRVGDINERPQVMPVDGKFTPNVNYALPTFDGTEESMRTMLGSLLYEKSNLPDELIATLARAARSQREARQAAKFPLRQPYISDDPNIQQLYSTKGRLNRLTVPMIFIWGLQDVIIPVENGFNHEDFIPNIQFFYPDRCGHLGQMDREQMFNELLLEFFRDGRVSWETAKSAGVSRRRAIDPLRVGEPSGGFPRIDRDAYSSADAVRRLWGQPA